MKYFENSFNFDFVESNLLKIIINTHGKLSRILKKSFVLRKKYFSYSVYHETSISKCMSRIS